MASHAGSLDAPPPGFWGWIGRASLLFLLVHLAVGVPVLLAQELLPAAQREVLDALAVFDAPRPTYLLGHLLRGGVLAAILYPIYPWAIRAPRARLVSFGFLWGLSMVGSVEPLPGSIEGWIYTETPLSGHVLILGATAVQALLLVTLLPVMEQRFAERTAPPSVPHTATGPGRWRGSVVRFTALHVATYLAMGLTFMLLQDYAEAFASQAAFAHYRPLDHPIVALAVPLQLLRGALLGVCVLPFVRAALAMRHGWAYLFAVVFGATALGSAGHLPGLVEGLVSDAGQVGASMLTGTPEIVVQMLVFAAAFMAWERTATGRSDAM